MRHPTTSFLVAVLAATHFAVVICFTGVYFPSCSSSLSSSSFIRDRHVARVPGASSGATSLESLTPSRSSSHSHASAPKGVTAGARSSAEPMASMMMSPRTRWRTRLAAVSGEGGNLPEESDSSVGEEEARVVEAPGGLDLSKGIAFEAPKPKAALEPEEEEESESKKIRVILYTVLSLVPFVLLLPFLGSRELMPLDPSQM